MPGYLQPAPDNTTADNLESLPRGRIDVTRVARDEKHHPIPASLTAHGPRENSVTEFNGARIDQDVQFTDADFTVAGVLK